MFYSYFRICLSSLTLLFTPFLGFSCTVVFKSLDLGGRGGEGRSAKCSSGSSARAPEHPPFHARRGFEATAPLVALRRSKSPRRSAPQPAAGPPTRAIAGARARSHPGHRAATVTPQSQRLMLTVRWKISLGLLGAPRTRRAWFSFRYCCHAALPRMLLAPFPMGLLTVTARARLARAACHRPDLESRITAGSIASFACTPSVLHARSW